MVFASHFLEQVLAVSDRLTVLRSGRRVAEFPAHQVERSELISLMIGRELAELRRIGSLRRSHRIDPAGPPYYSARQLAARQVDGSAGRRGAGRTELARLLTGGATPVAGSAVLVGHAISLRSPRGALRHHIAMASEDRLREGVITGLSIRDNIVLALQSRRG